MSDEYSIIRVKDFYQACLLKTLGFPLLRLEGGGNKFKEFVFSDPDFVAEEQLGNYWDGLLQVDPKKFVSNIKELKQRLFSESRQIR